MELCPTYYKKINIHSKREWKSFVGLVIYSQSEMTILLKTGDYENFDDDKIERLISQLLFF